MSSSDKDLNIPNLGPAQRDHDVAPAPRAAADEPTPAAKPAPAAAQVQAAPAAAPRRRGFGIFTGGLLLMVLAACGGLGYWMMDLQLQFQTRTVELTEARYQLGELQELLKSAEDSALESGKSLITQVGELNTAAQKKYSHYDSELAKLNTKVDQRNRLQLDAQKKALAEQQTAMAAQAKQLKSQDGQITDLLALVEAQKTLLDEQAVLLQSQQSRLEQAEKQLQSQAGNVEKAVEFVTALKISQEEMGANQNANSRSAEAALADLKKELASTRAELSTQAGILNEQLAEQADSLSALQSSAGKAPAADPGLSRRIAINEDAIQAFDGTRRQLNRELLQIRQKLNNLQLRIESR